MLANRRQKGKYQYTVPSPDSYPYQWLWDSCFHAIILTHYKVEDAKAELLSLIAKQFDSGMIPHMNYWHKPQKTSFPQIDWGKEGSSSITQPPMLAFAIWQIFQKDRDTKFLKSVYPSLYHFYNYLLTERDPHQKHLIGIMNPDESGEDNAPRFDLPLNLHAKQPNERNYKRRFELIKQNIECKFDAPFCMRNFFWVKDVPFNAILVENLRILSLIANELNFYEDSEYYHYQALLIKAAMRSLMLEDGIFWSTYGKDYKKIKVKTWAIFSVLFAKIATDQEAKNLIKNHFLNAKEFYLPFILPSTPKSDPAFDPNGFWRGPIWMATNWIVFKGLKNYGFHLEAQSLLESSLKLLEKSGFREQYNPLTGEGYGARNFTWGGLVVDMVES
jgi:glycogen debranching enzyme